MKDPLLRYRVMATAVGVVLIVLVFVAIPLRYGFGYPSFSETISPIHGALYIVLVAMVFLLGRDRGWGLTRMVLVALAGTIPIFSFVMERRVTAAETRSEADAPPAVRTGDVRAR